MSRMSRLVHKVALSVAVVVAVVVGASVVSGGGESKPDAKAGASQALLMTQTLADDINWG
ncbi:hypothetical protein [Kitasatospora sp. NPDC018623]|uniref:hypothetical protein n=2 Tax=unclassified Kitasatospora TaxID=2633591 RepID=UPI0037BBC5C3